MSSKFFVFTSHFCVLSLVYLSSASGLHAQALTPASSANTTAGTPSGFPEEPNKLPSGGHPSSPAAETTSTGGTPTEDNTMAPIIVTGSVIPTTETEGAAPVVTVDSAEIERRGYQTVSDILRNVPANGSFSSPGTTSNAFAAGAAFVSLRGLGPQATLVLVNGRRVEDYAEPANGQYGFVDLNSIPTQIVDRVEVLTEGSALYGSDAVAGVVNIITKTSIGDDDGQLQAYFGNTQNRDAFEQRYSAIGSLSSFDKNGTGIVSVDYESQNSVLAQDEAFSQTANHAPQGGLDLRSGRTFPGQFQGENSGNYFSLLPGTGNVPLTATTAPADPNVDNDADALQGFNYNGSYTSIQPYTQRYGVYATYSYNFFGGDVRPSVDFNYRHNYTFLQEAPAGTVIGDDGPFEIVPNGPNAGSAAFIVPTTNPYNQTGEPIDLVAYRFTELGPRIEETSQDSFRTVPQVDIRLGDDWTLNLGLNYDYAFVDDVNIGFPGAHEFQNALNGTTLATAYNPFTSELGAVPGNLADSLLVNSEQRDTTSLFGEDFRFNGKLFDLPAGPVQFAGGGEYRLERYNQSYGPNDLSGDVISSTIQRDTAASRKVLAGYVEVDIPITSKKFNIPGFYQVDLDVSGRVDKYSSFGSTENPQVKLRWEVIPGLVLRGSYATSFRAPSLPELFAGGNQAVEFVNDPVGGPRDVTVNGGGNPNLKPETAETFSAGVAYSPQQLKGLLFTGDFFKIRYTNQIQQEDAQDLIDENSPQVLHNPNGTIASVTATYSNLSKTIVQGVDAGVQYVIGDSMGKWGMLSFTLNGTWLLDYLTDDGTGLSENVGIDSNGLGGYPRYRQEAEITYDYRGFEFNVANNFSSGYDDSSVEQYDIFRKVDSVNTFDLQTSYTFDKDLDKVAPAAYAKGMLPFGFDWRQIVSGTKILFGVNNVYNSAPPFTADTSDTLGYDPTYADGLGRFFYVELSKRF